MKITQSIGKLIIVIFVVILSINPVFADEAANIPENPKPPETKIDPDSAKKPKEDLAVPPEPHSNFQSKDVDNTPITVHTLDAPDTPPDAGKLDRSNESSMGFYLQFNFGSAPERHESHESDEKKDN